MVHGYGFVRRGFETAERPLVFALNTILMVAGPTCGPTGVNHPPLTSQNIQPHEKSLTRYRARGETQTMSLALGTYPEGKERVKGKASRIQSSRIGSALAYVRRNAQHRELKLTRVQAICAQYRSNGCCVHLWSHRLPSMSSSPLVPKHTVCYGVIQLVVDPLRQ